MSFALLAMAVSSSTDLDPESGNRGYTLLIVFALVAIGFSFLCSIAEAVLLSVTPSYIATLKERNQRAASLLAKLKRSIDRPLAAILSLNTIAHTVGAAGVGAEALAIWGSAAVGITSALMTLLILVLSEIIPKTIGAVYWRSLAPSMASIVQVLIWVLWPLVWMSDLLTRMISGGHVPKMVTREEVLAMATLGAKGGELDVKESRILQNLFRLDSLTVEDIMTPRTVLIAFSQDTTIAEAHRQLQNVPVTRIPVYEDNIDRVVGLVLKTDILLAHASGKANSPLSELRRDLKAVPWNASLKQLLEELLDQREHLALVVDEYGGTDGLVTLEDLIETLLGIEIVDEHDTSTDMQALARRQWRRRAEALGLDLKGLNENLATVAPQQNASIESTKKE